MRFSKWNEDEVATYKRLTESKEVTMERIEGLAYTAVHEMYISRIEQEKIKQEHNAIINAMDQIADGICTLERILGVSLKDMAQRHFAQKLEMARKGSEVKHGTDK